VQPTTDLPPRPDNPSFVEGRRSGCSSGDLSVGGTSRPITLYTILWSPSQPRGIGTSSRLGEKTKHTEPESKTEVEDAERTNINDRSQQPTSAQLLAIGDQTILMPQTEGEDSYGPVHTELLVVEPTTTMQNYPNARHTVRGHRASHHYLYHQGIRLGNC